MGDGAPVPLPPRRARAAAPARHPSDRAHAAGPGPRLRPRSLQVRDPLPARALCCGAISRRSNTPAAWTRCAGAIRSSRCRRASSSRSSESRRLVARIRRSDDARPIDRRRRSRRVDRQRIGWLFEGGELAGEQRRPGEMAGGARSSRRAKRRLVGLQVDEPDAAQRAAQQVAIALLQRRAGDDERARGDRAPPPRPRAATASHGARSASVSGDAVAHLRDRRRRVVVVAVDEPPAELSARAPGRWWSCPSRRRRSG